MKNALRRILKDDCLHLLNFINFIWEKERERDRAEEKDDIKQMDKVYDKIETKTKEQGQFISISPLITDN